MIGALVGIGLPAMAAWIAARRLSPARVVRGEDLAVTLAIAFGLASVVWPGLLLLGATSRAVVLTGDVIVWVAIISALTLSRRASGERARQPPTATPASAPHPQWRATAAVLILLPIAALAIASFAASSAVAPHGEWDAWAQWNLRARFFFRGVTGPWRQAFAPVLAWSHPDYPPLVSASIARAWLYAGSESVVAPILFAAGSAATIVIAAAASVGRVHGAGRACLAAAAILACPSFVRYAPAQCADVPLAAFMLLAFIAAGQAAHSPDARWWWGTAGMSAALAAWTKNEGAAFFVVFTLAAIVAMLRSGGFAALRVLAPFALGAAPVLVALLVFKRVLAPPSYFVAEQSLAGAAANLFTAARLHAVATAMARELWFSGATVVGVVPAMALIVGTRGMARPADAGARAAWPVMAAMIVAYMAAYLVSPKDLGWQLATSLDRVVMQMVPTIVWAAMMIAR